MKEPITTRVSKALALEGNIRVLAATGFLFGAYQGMLWAIWQPFVLSLGASVSVLGLLESLGGRMGIVSSLIQPLGGWFADRLGRKPLMVIASLVTATGLVLDALAAILGTWPLLVPGVMLTGLGMLGRSVRLTVTAESVDNEQRGMAYSAVTFFFIVPGIAAPAAGGVIAERWGFLSILLAAAVIEILILGLVLRFLRETVTRHTGRLRLSELEGVLLRMALPPRGMRGLYLATAADTFVWGLGSALLFGLLTEVYGFTLAQLGVLASLMSLSWAVAQLPVGRLIDRYGGKSFLILSELLGLVTYGMWLSFTSFRAFALSYLMMGLVAATWVPAMTTLLANSVAEEERGEAMGRLFAFRGLVRFPAPVLSGMLYAWGGFRAPLMAGLAGVAGVILLIAWLVREPAARAAVETAG